MPSVVPRIAFPLLTLLTLTLASSSAARPSGPRLFCEAYPESATCAGRGTNCITCHTSTSPTAPDWNEYGLAILVGLGDGGLDFEGPGALAGVLSDLDSDDADGDGLTNLEEILLGTLPGDATSHFVPPPPSRGGPNPAFSVGSWDPAFALRRALVAFCGRSPTFVQMRAVASAADPRAHVHQQLEACLQSEYWTNEGLSRLADERVRPISLGTSFLWDYRLWRYVMTNDRDVRELVIADYHVREPEPGVLVRVEEVDDDASACDADDDCAADSVCATDNGNVCRYRDGGQPLIKSERAGMLGTQWFHFINTMFSALPRTTAATAMRGYLGQDIAKQEGIHPIINEPLDVDAKGVKQEECAQCHATLDPASYVFAQYRGIEEGGASRFDPQRPIEKGLWTANTRPQGVILGQPVETLKDWAQVVSTSDEFQNNLARVLFEHAVGRPPGPPDHDEFQALWPSWSSLEVGFSANRFLHRLVDTNSFGAP